MFDSNQFFGGGAAEFYPKTIDQSLRFNDNDSANLTRTFTSEGDRTTWTFSCWVKRANISLAEEATLFSSHFGASQAGSFSFRFDTDDTLEVVQYTTVRRKTNAVYRDTSAWYHIVLQVDTNGDFFTIWVNGAEVTSFSTSSNPSAGSNVGVNYSTQHTIGRNDAAVNKFFDGYLAEVHFCDGEAYTADDFGELKSGVWVAKSPSVTYGTNGFYLDFANSADIGNDVSGEGNDWTPNNFTASDVVLDSPTDNYPTFNPLATNMTLADGNKDANSTSDFEACALTMSCSGKNYFEIEYVTQSFGGGNETIGVVSYGQTTRNWQTAVASGIGTNGRLGYAMTFEYSRTDAGVECDEGSVTSSVFTSLSAGDIAQIAVDTETGKIWFGTNGTWENSGDPAAGTNPSATKSWDNFTVAIGGHPTNKFRLLNNSDEWNYTPPTGYLALSTANLPEPTISPADDAEPRDYFETFLYTGNGAGLQVGDVIKKPADTTTISNSLVFDRASDAYLSKSSVEGDDRKKITISLWVKRSSYISSAHNLISAGWSGSGWLSGLTFSSSSNILWFNSNSGGSGAQGYITSDLALKDTSSWHHIVAIWDTTEATSTDRMRLYLDGVRLTVTDNATPSQNALSYYLSQSGNNGYYIGQQAYTGGSDNFDGYMAEIHYIDGYVYEPTTFGAFDANGIWIPKAVTGVTYGTAGWHLDFSDNTSTTTLGEDSSGNNADWTLNNFATTDQVDDSPTDNIPYNISIQGGNVTISEGGLKTSVSTDNRHARSAMRLPPTGKWYWEAEILVTNTNHGISIVNNDYSLTITAINAADAVTYNVQSGTVFAEADGGTFYATAPVNNTVGVAFDADTGRIWFRNDSGWLNSGDPAAGTGYVHTVSTWGQEDWFPAVISHGSANKQTFFNFGQRAFEHTVPTGFSAMTEDNITVNEDNLESPDFVWIKNRDQGDKHHLYDSVRGIQEALYSNANTAETDEPNGLLDFNANGFTIGSEAEVNTLNEDYVAWCWKANGSGVSNTDGSITSSVSANTESGFSIVSYTGTSSQGTIGHGLSQAPDLIIHKRRNSTNSWLVSSNEGGLTVGSNYIYLDENLAKTSNGDNTQSFDATTWQVGTGGNSNTSGAPYIAYVFHSVDGFSKIGGYTGNGSTTDGPFVYTGFRPAWLVVKRTNTSGDSWLIFDSARETYNVMTTTLDADTSTAEDSSTSYHNVDFLSNGFKLREDGGGANASGGTYIYMAFAENPFKYSNAR